MKALQPVLTIVRYIGLMLAAEEGMSAGRRAKGVGTPEVAVAVGVAVAVTEAAVAVAAPSVDVGPGMVAPHARVGAPAAAAAVEH